MVQVPIGIESTLSGVVDLVKMKAQIWKNEALGAEWEYKDIPDDLKEISQKYRTELVETAVEQDEKLMEAYLNGDEIKEQDLINCIRKGTLNFSFVPVLTGSAFKNKGVQPLLDAVVNYLPSPVDIGSIKGTKLGTEDEMEMKFDDNAPFSALAFKVANDPFVGSLTFIRIYSGTIKTGTAVFNSSKEKEERVGRMLLMHANSREDIKEANAGDIVALAGLKNTITGHTLCDEENSVLLEPMEFPDPVIEIAVEPKTKADQEKMGEALGRLAKEDPSFRVTSDEESGQTIIKGMGELHLDIIVDRMKREFKVEANIGAPQVAYRETIESASEVEYTHKKQSGGAGQFAKVKLLVEPQEPGKGREVESKIKGGAIPKEFIPGVEKGIETVSDGGILAGFPMIDYKVTILDGLHHDVDSSVLAFELASRACFKDACTKGGLKLLEPIMRVEVVTPEDYMGDVIGDLNSRRGQINTQEQRGNVIKKADDNEARYYLVPDSILSIKDGQKVYAGDVIARLPKETTKTKDITGGLPRVAELFEARKAKDSAIIAENDGQVVFGKEVRGKQKVSIVPEDGKEPSNYLIPKGKHINFNPGEKIQKGEYLLDGQPLPHDILRILGIKELTEYFVNQVQEVYRLQGVIINDKHIETILRQMLKKVEVKLSGDSNYLPGEVIDRIKFENINEKLVADGKKPAVGERILMGITKASLQTESFISAASFQETTRVLTDAAIKGKVDPLNGLKENVIVGRLVPAGTGNIKNRWNKKAIEDDNKFIAEKEKIEATDPSETQTNQ